MEEESPAPSATDELGQAVRLLQGVMQAEGVSAEEVDARRGRPAGTTAAWLAGGGIGAGAGAAADSSADAELARRELRSILAALEIEPELFLAALSAPAAPPLPSVPLFERLAAELAVAGYAPRSAAEPQGGAESPDPAELERRVREAIRTALADEGGDDPHDPGNLEDSRGGRRR